VDYWQIENEPFGATVLDPECNHPINTFWIGNATEYVTLLNECYTALKDASPTDTVILAGKASSATLSAFFQQAVAYGNFDVVDLHSYDTPADSMAMLQAVQALLVVAEKSAIPIWMTESGEVDTDTYSAYAAALDDPAELRLQSSQLIVRHVEAFATGVSRIMRLALNPYDADESPTVKWNHMRLNSNTAGTTHKPAYYAYALMVEKLDEFTAVEELSDNIYKFTVGGNPVVVAWCPTCLHVDFSSYFEGESTLQVTRPPGTTANNTITIEPITSIGLTKMPCFVEAVP
jgi:alpha-L-arabinofuranosidase